MPRTWEKEEITYLKRYAAKKHLAELAVRFDTRPEEVARKLAELGLKAKDSLAKLERKPDPFLKDFEQGLQAVQKGKWKIAAKHLEKVVEGTQQVDLAERARRFLAICRQQLGGGKATQEEDPFARAVFERNRGNLEEALEICSRGGRQSKDDRFAYLAAAVHTLQGDHETAGKFLSLAIEMNPKNRVHAYHDSDFDDLRQDPDYKQLFS